MKTEIYLKPDIYMTKPCEVENNKLLFAFSLFNLNPQWSRYHCEVLCYLLCCLLATWEMDRFLSGKLEMIIPVRKCLLKFLLQFCRNFVNKIFLLI